MKEIYYLLDPNGEKIGPVDILELTKWARDGKILPENTICDIDGDTFNARDIISFIKVTPRQPKSSKQNIKPYVILVIVLGVLCALCCVAYLGMRANYMILEQDHRELKGKYDASIHTIENLEKENNALKVNAQEFIKKMVEKYNLVESERDDLTDKLNSALELNKSLQELNEVVAPEPQEEKEFTGIPLPE